MKRHLGDMGGTGGECGNRDYVNVVLMLGDNILKTKKKKEGYWRFLNVCQHLILLLFLRFPAMLVRVLTPQFEYYLNLPSG